MAKDREVVCKYYEYEGKCKKGREPARKNLRRAKLEKLRKEGY